MCGSMPRVCGSMPRVCGSMPRNHIRVFVSLRLTSKNKKESPFMTSVI